MLWGYVCGPRCPHLMEALRQEAVAWMQEGPEDEEEEEEELQAVPLGAV